jgi:hypothetical protein
MSLSLEPHKGFRFRIFYRGYNETLPKGTPVRLSPQVTMTLARAPQGSKNESNPESSAIDWDVVGQKAAIFQETAEVVGKLAFKAYFAKRLLDTVCEIAVIAAKAKIK